MVKLPQVVIVGRMNVGKSTLFNRLADNVKSLTLNYEGVTRDFIRDSVYWQAKNFEIIDSGGIGLKKSQDPIAEKVRILALRLVEKADVILFVCDGTIEPTLQDVELAKYLKKLNKPVILVLNKIDAPQHEYEHWQSFKRLGFHYQVSISALHGKGMPDLLDLVLKNLPKEVLGRDEKSEDLSIAFLGKPNVGKSSLMNLLLQEERMLISDVAGTTRESITEPIKFYQETILLTDTPGVRRKRAIDEPLEKMMVQTALQAVKRVHLIALIIDGSEGTISDQELKLAFYAFQEGKSLVLLINKADLIDEYKQSCLKDEFTKYAYFLDKIPMLYISCVTNKNIGKILPLVKQVWQRSTQKFTSYELTMLFKEALTRTPLYKSGDRLIFKSAEQVSTGPLRIVLRVKRAGLWGPTQLAFFENIMRRTYQLKGASILFSLR